MRHLYDVISAPRLSFAHLTAQPWFLIYYDWVSWWRKGGKWMMRMEWQEKGDHANRVFIIVTVVWEFVLKW